MWTVLLPGWVSVSSSTLSALHCEKAATLSLGSNQPHVCPLLTLFWSFHVRARKKPNLLSKSPSDGWPYLCWIVIRNPRSMGGKYGHVASMIACPIEVIWGSACSALSNSGNTRSRWWGLVIQHSLKWSHIVYLTKFQGCALVSDLIIFPTPSIRSCAVNYSFCDFTFGLCNIIFTVSRSVATFGFELVIEIISMVYHILIWYHLSTELFKGHLEKIYFNWKYLIGAHQIIWLAPNNDLARTKSFGLNQIIIWSEPNHLAWTK